MSEELLLNLAVTCERIGDQRLAETKQTMRREPGEPPLSESAFRLANQQSAMFYDKAALYYKQHADLITIENNVLHGNM